jgi:hypothetical protein
MTLALRPRAASMFARNPVDQGDVFASLCDVLRMHVEDVAELGFTDKDTGAPGWSAVVDADRAPDAWLDWLSQFPGVRRDPAVTDAGEKRRRIKEARGQHRGKLSAILSELRTTLVSATDGPAYVFVDTSDGPHHLVFVTHTAETPDEAASTARLNAKGVKPLGAVYELNVVDGWAVGEMEDAYDGLTVADLEGDYATVSALDANQPS